MPRMPETRILISSLGLMGGSLAAALSAAGWTVLLHHRRPEVAKDAEQQGFGTAIENIENVIADVDCVVVCTPLNVSSSLIREYATFDSAAVITDVGSTKALICQELEDLAASGRFVGSHPMAGSHLQGLANAKSDLFQNAHCAITPHPDCPNDSIAMITRLWQAAGCSVHRYKAIDHDQAVAEVSHLPHVLSSAAAMALSDRGLPLAATGYRDTTRVAAGSAELWRDILLQNKDAAAFQLRCSIKDLQRLLDALKCDDQAAVQAWLQQGCDSRARFDQRNI
jgi:prephenate dehydrogenase